MTLSNFVIRESNCKQSSTQKWYRHWPFHMTNDSSVDIQPVAQPLFTPIETLPFTEQSHSSTHQTLNQNPQSLDPHRFPAKDTCFHIICLIYCCGKQQRRTCKASSPFSWYNPPWLCQTLPVSRWLCRNTELYPIAITTTNTGNQKKKRGFRVAELLPVSF